MTMYKSHNRMVIMSLKMNKNHSDERLNGHLLYKMTNNRVKLEKKTYKMYNYHLT